MVLDGMLNMNFMLFFNIIYLLFLRKIYSYFSKHERQIFI